MALVRLERPGEEAAVRAVVADAFGDERTPALVDGMRGSSAWRALSFVAEEAGAIVGHVSYTRGWLDAPSRLIEVLVLSPLSVASAFQGRGIGGALVRESLAALQGRPEPLVFLEGSPRYYGRLGFRPGGEAGFVAPSPRIPAAAFQFVTLTAYEPWMTGTLVYPDVFWEHDCVGLRP
ncbi:MAG TPA: N-acetyltransferase [Fimbriimonadaceae bacterium]|nr:N-acetyltransferase [Fimbriimonadaceae bacterium]